MKLAIDSSRRERLIIGLVEGEKGVVSREVEAQFGSQVLLRAVEEIFKEAGIRWSDISAVEVATGPGSYTGVRVGVSVANAIGYALSILVNGKQFETDLVYEA